MEDDKKIKYCLYARKSSEQDERQAMSIDSQIKEMTDLAQKEELFVKEIRQESHSAKTSNTRPVFIKLIEDVKSGHFNGILTWAPDRLSRNAGDLGQLVDLMDQKVLIQIKTFSQSFSDNPNEKFLLMILCSQAKLENDQKGLNVKRGIRAKCEMGWRPGIAPLGYINRSFAGVRDIMVDTERASLVAQAFERVAYKNHSGRAIKEWFDRAGFTNRSGKKTSLSQIYTLLKNPFYYGEFEYPIGSGNWYKGKYKPLITKELYKIVQSKLIPTHLKKWGTKEFAFTGFLKCGACLSGITAEEKFRKLKFGGFHHHIYYHCTRSRDLHCPEKYLEEKDMVKQLIALFKNETIEIDQNNLTKKLKQEIERYQRLTTDVLEDTPWRIASNTAVKLKQKAFVPDNKIITAYVKHILRIGTVEERKEIMLLIKSKIYLKNQILAVNLGKAD